MNQPYATIQHFLFWFFGSVIHWYIITQIMISIDKLLKVTQKKLFQLILIVFKDRITGTVLYY